MSSTQLRFELFEEDFIAGSPTVAAAIDALAEQEGAAARGAIFTRPEVVDFILDLATPLRKSSGHGCSEC